MPHTTVPPVPVTALETFGEDLARPECVIGSATGDVYVSDWRGGVTVVRHDGTQQRWLAEGSSFALKPNGIALTPGASFLVAHLSDTGGVWALGQDGPLVPVVTEVDGIALPPTNFVDRDRLGRLWISISTRHEPRQLAWRPDVADGFIVLVDERGARIVADGLHYTNEVRPDPTGQWLYAVETFGRRVIRMPIGDAGALGVPETVVSLGPGCFPDGFAFDESGGLWITSLISNRVLRLEGDRLDTVVEDANATFIEAAERAFAEGTMSAERLGPIPDTRLQHVTSIAFGGPDRRTAYLGSLHGTCIYRFRTTVAGVVPEHWHYDRLP